ncbi:hypothetical protein [Hyphomonas sp.]|uniref:hypothetical protein n=1 Tax=Hyphomonas sp. TaxID=87 RepID=UPI0025C36CC0|nr:hypothetical protein [Hyphomonas sp.]
MSDKNFIVLAECVDSRVRPERRYVKGDTFDPPPGVEQAERLHKAGCLSEDAVKAAGTPAASKARKAAGVEEKTAEDIAAERAAAEKVAAEKLAADLAAKRKAAGKLADEASKKKPEELRVEAAEFLGADNIPDKPDDVVAALKKFAAEGK